MGNAEKSLQRQLDLRAEYQEGLADRMLTITGLWADICIDGWKADLVRQIRDECHYLVSTGETFGFTRTSKFARVVEMYLSRALDRNEEPDRSQLDEMAGAINCLLAKGPIEDSYPKVNIVKSASESVEQAFDLEQHEPQLEHAQQQVQEQEVPIEREARGVQPLSTLPIYIVEDDQALADRIVTELAHQGYDGRAVYDLDEFESLMMSTDVTPGAIIMDVIFADRPTGGIDLINKLREDDKLNSPVVFVSANGSFSNRLNIVRTGADAFFVKPIDVSAMVEKIESLVGETDPDPLRVLVVDDDELFTNLICVVLEDAGLHAKGINDPTTAVDQIFEFDPDLVILDMYMPEVNGMELAQVLRQHESCGDIPLLFLSAETDPAVQAEVLNIGVDDFLVKPIDHRYLISAVANRARRARAVGAKIFRDSLTQLLVHDETKKQLEIQLSAADRHATELCYVILDLDNFKQINDTHGHLTGDQVIKSLVSLLRRSFRRSDILGRYGGDEFVAIMLDTGLDDAAAVLEKVRDEFSQIEHRSEADGTPFTTTISIGISSYPKFTEPEELQVSADRALYAAKKAGRNKIELA